MPSYSVNSTTAVPVSSADNELCIQINKGVLWGLWVYAVKKEKKIHVERKKKERKRKIRIFNVSTNYFIS